MSSLKFPSLEGIEDMTSIKSTPFLGIEKSNNFLCIASMSVKIDLLTIVAYLPLRLFVKCCATVIDLLFSGSAI